MQTRAQVADLPEKLNPNWKAATEDQPNTGSHPYEFSFPGLPPNGEDNLRDKRREQEMSLFFALAFQDLRELGQLLDKGTNPNMTLPQPVPQPLIRLFGNDYTARVLAKDYPVTPLMLAVLSGQVEAVRLLLRHGANTQIHTRKFHMYPLDFAAELKLIPIMQLILGRDPTRDGEGRHVVVSLSLQKGWFYQDATVLLETPVSTGRTGFATKAGEYVVTQKYPAWKSTLYKVPMPNFMRLNCGQTGLHGGVVPGIPASHGCIRMPNEMAAALYQIILPGDRVSIVE